MKEVTHLTLKEAKQHIGHSLAIVTYGDQNISIECETCSQVLQDWDNATEL